jgi:2-polyprenyl-6-methoxyphenol hydroxylase-like FAD-dependent oxidoreductase
MEKTILIVGAGPTGLVLALWLAKLGVHFRIIDKDSGSGQTSRAMAIHARTLEFYQQIGIADEVVAKGIIIEQLNLQKNGNPVASIDFSDLGKNISPFPFVLSFPQDDHEKLLIAHLEKMGFFVERNTELVNFTQNENQVIATLKTGDKVQTFTTPFILGCDGARSTVRSQLGINFPGGTYSQVYYVADVMTTGKTVDHGIQVCLGDYGFSLAFPIRSSGSIRLIGIVPKQKEHKADIEFSDIEPSVVSNTQIAVSKVNWFSTYRSHHRVAEHFKIGRVFLLGDAGHIHSPVGGQGMNTGIGDAVNLAWKVAAVLQDRAAISILASYEIERMNFAKRLIMTTDKMFQAITNEGVLGKFIRDIFFPHVLPFFMRFQNIKHFLFNTVSQIKINYRKSPLSKGRLGKIKAGDRLPWIKEIDNYKSLMLLDWQIHIYGQITFEFKNFLQQQKLMYYEFAWEDIFKKVGFEKNAVYLIRPDGYIAYIDLAQNHQSLENFLNEFK